MFGGRDDGPFGDTLDGAPDGTRTGVLGRPSAPPPGTARRRRTLTRSQGRQRSGFPGGPTPTPPGGCGPLGLGTDDTGTTGILGALTRNVTVQEGIGGGPPGPAPPPTQGLPTGGLLTGGLLTGGGGIPLVGRLADGIRGNNTGPTADRHLEDVRVTAHARHLVRLQHAAVSPDDPAHDGLVHRVAAGVRPAHLDADALAALGRRHHDGVVQVTARRHRRVAGRVDARHVRDQMREGCGEQPGVDLGLDRRSVHGELHPPGPDQLDGPVDPGGDDGVQHHLRTGDASVARVEPLVAEDVVDQRRDARIARRQMVQHLVGLGPELPGVVRGQRGQLAAQLLQRPAQRPPEQGQQLLVPGGERLVAVLLPLPEGGVPVLVRAEFLGVPLLQLLQLGDVLLTQRGQLGGVLLGDPLQLFLVALLCRLLLLDDGVVRPPVGEGHHGTDELVAVAHGRGRQIDRHLAAVLGVQHLPAHPVLAPGAQGVGERRLLVREGRAVGPRVQHEIMQFAPAEIAGPETQDLGRGRIDQHDPPVGVRSDDTLGRRPQDHLGLPLRPGQLGLGVHGPGEVTHDEHEQLVAGVAVTVVGLLPVLEIRTGDLDGELGPVRPARDHPGRLGPGLRIEVLRPPHGARDELGVELRQQIEQPAPHQSGARSLEGLQGDGVGVDDRPVGIDQHQRVGKGVQYGCEASSASGWPAAHESLPPCYRTLPTARAILPTGPRRVTRGSLRAAVALATPDAGEVPRASDPELTTE